MKTVFADTYYFLALWNPDDPGHARAVAFTDGYREKVLTTDWIITELADGLSRTPNRAKFVKWYRILQKQDELAILPASREMFGRGMELFENRPDKDWTLTDCISMVVMQAAEISEALTADRHFEQAGFIALLK